MSNVIKSPFNNLSRTHKKMVSVKKPNEAKFAKQSRKKK